MRKLTVLPFAALTAVLVGAASGHATSGLGQTMEAAKPEVRSYASLKNVTGDVVSIDKEQRTMTIKESRFFRSEEVTFAVAEPLVSILDTLRPDDQVTVSYVEAHGHLIAKRITKVPAQRAS